MSNKRRRWRPQRELKLLRQVRAGREAWRGVLQPEILFKTDKTTLEVEALADGKIKVRPSAWDDAKVIMPGDALEVRAVDGQLVALHARCGPCGPARILTAAKYPGFDQPILSLAKSNVTWTDCTLKSVDGM